MAITKEQADALLAAGQIGPETHAMVVAQSGGAMTPDPRMAAGGMSSAPAPAAGGYNAQLDMSAPVPRPGSGISVSPVGTPVGGSDPFGLGASLPQSPAPIAMPGAGRSTATPVGAAAPDQFGLLPGAPGSALAAPAPTQPSGIPAQSGGGVTPSAQSNIPQQSRPLNIIREEGGMTVLKTARQAEQEAAARSAAPTGLAPRTTPSGPSGPSSDPRVNRLYAQYMKQYQGVIDAGDKVMAAQSAIHDAERDRDQRLADNASDFVRTLEAADIQMQADFHDYQAARDAQLQNVRKAADEAAAARIDPERFWNSRSTGQAIAGGIALALGALGAAMAKTPNYALQQIDAAISRDIDAQQKEMDQKWNKANWERNALADLRSAYGDTRTARADMARRAYDRSIAVGEQIAAESKNPIAQAQWGQTKALLEEKRKQYEFDVLQSMQQRVAQMDAAAASAARSRANEERKFFLERYGKALDTAQAELEKAATEQRSPQPWAVETLQKAAERGMIVPTGEAVGAGAGNPLAGIPKPLQSKAAEELEAMANKQQAAAQLGDIYQQAAEKLKDTEWRAQSAIPGTTAYKERTQWNAVIHQRMTGRGLASENDADKAITPFFVSPTDNPDDALSKGPRAIGAFAARNPTPILDMYGRARANLGPQAPAGPVGPPKLPGK